MLDLTLLGQSLFSIFRVHKKVPLKGSRESGVRGIFAREHGHVMLGRAQWRTGGMNQGNEGTKTALRACRTRLDQAEDDKVAYC